MNRAGARKLAATWPWRWSTGASGSLRAAAIALAVLAPTSSAATSPGPRVVATRSMSASVTPARVERVGDDGVDQLQVMAARDLGHDAAVAVVDPLRGDDVGPDLPILGDDGRTGVVTARLQGEDHAVAALPRALVRHMIIASSPVSG